MYCNSTTMLYIKIVFLSIIYVSGFDPSLKTEPKEIVLGGGKRTTRLRVTCIQPEDDHVLKIVVGKIVSHGVSRDLVRVSVSDEAPVVEEDSIRRRSSVRGELSKHGGYIQLDLYQLQCGDAAVYYCMTVIGNDRRRRLDTADVTVRANPEIPFMRVTPRGSWFRVGLDITLKCSGRIGSDPATDKRLWRWEWRMSDKLSPWTDYPFLSNITQDTPTPSPTSTCEYEASSTLTHTVTKQDHGRVIRCSVLDPEFSDQMTIHLDEDNSLYTTPIIVLAGVVTGMCFILISVVLGVVVYRSVTRPPTHVLFMTQHTDITTTDNMTCTGSIVHNTDTTPYTPRDTGDQLSQNHTNI